MLEERIDDPFPEVPEEQPADSLAWQKPDSEEAGPSEVRSFPIYRTPSFAEPLLHLAMDLTLRISAVDLWRMTVGGALSSLTAPPVHPAFDTNQALAHQCRLKGLLPADQARPQQLAHAPRQLEPGRWCVGISIWSVNACAGHTPDSCSSCGLG